MSVYVMSVISELKREVEEAQRTSVSVDERLREGLVTGAGDSYAVCLALEGVTKGRFRCVDPYELLGWNFRKPLLIISVSGRPRVLRSLAERQRGKGKILLITANPRSKLFELADRKIVIPFSPPDSPRPGMGSFLLTLRAAYSLADHEEVVGVGREVKIGRTPVFVGQGGNFGIAYFSYLKMAEIFGEPSNAERLEQFLHSPIFASVGRKVIVLSSGDERERKLKERGGRSFVMTGCRTSLCNAVSIIRSIIAEMERRSWEKVYFAENESVLKLSSDMIY